MIIVHLIARDDRGNNVISGSTAYSETFDGVDENVGYTYVAPPVVNFGGTGSPADSGRFAPPGTSYPYNSNAPSYTFGGGSSSGSSNNSVWSWAKNLVNNITDGIGSVIHGVFSFLQTPVGDFFLSIGEPGLAHAIHSGFTKMANDLISAITDDNIIGNLLDMLSDFALNPGNMTTGAMESGVHMMISAVINGVIDVDSFGTLMVVGWVASALANALFDYIWSTWIYPALKKKAEEG
jgi:hypothetical protein